MSAITLGRDPLEMVLDIHLVWEMKGDDLETGQEMDEDASNYEMISEGVAETSDSDDASTSSSQ